MSSSNRVFSKATGRKAGGGFSNKTPTARPVTSNQTFVLHFLSPHWIYSFDQHPEFKPVVQLYQRHVKEPFMQAQYSKSNNSSQTQKTWNAHAKEPTCEQDINEFITSTWPCAHWARRYTCPYIKDGYHMQLDGRVVCVTAFGAEDCGDDNTHEDTLGGKKSNSWRVCLHAHYYSGIFLSIFRLSG